MSLALLMVMERRVVLGTILRLLRLPYYVADSQCLPAAVSIMLRARFVLYHKWGETEKPLTLTLSHKGRGNYINGRFHRLLP
jgi:hypothetical protein